MPPTPDTSPSAPGWETLSDLAGRIGGGIQPALQSPGPAAPREPLLDRALVTQWHELVDDLMSDGSTPSINRVSAHLGAVAADLAGSRRRLFDYLYHPLTWVQQLLQSPSGPAAPSDPLRGHAVWAMCCHMVEVLWGIVSGDTVLPLQVPPPQPSPLSDVDRRMLRPVAARLRFLVLSEPFRHRASNSPWIPPAEATLSGHEPFKVVFGDGSWHLLVAGARQARWTWKEYLDTFESHPLLAQASPKQIEDEIDALLFCGPRPAGTLQITPDPLDDQQSAGPDDAAIRRDLAGRHLLPRFRITTTLRLAYSSGLARTDPGWKYSWALPGITTAAAVLAGLGLLTGVGAVVLALVGWFHWALLSAVGCYVVVGGGAVVTGPLFTLPWLLRWPAASALGMLALVGLNGDWWATAANTWHPVLLTSGLLAGAGFGYLVIEVRNHHVWGRPALRRAGTVLGVGLLHATLVSLVGLVGVLPRFAEDGAELATIFANADHGQAWRILMLTVAWCLATGVFSQVLWDDRPITAPLAHTGWRGGNDV